MRRFQSLKMRVVDETGDELCSCRDALTAQQIADALNRAEPPGPPPPYNLLLRPERLKGARLTWPSGSLLDDPQEDGSSPPHVEGGTSRKRQLDERELDALALSTPAGRAAYEETRLALQLGRRMRQARKAADLSRAEVAKCANIDEQELRRLESGDGILAAKLEIFERIARALNRRIRIQFIEIDR